jgi:N-acetylglucosamine malate deacetylase 1
MSRILVLSPHPDDEAIGCGGTLRKHIVEGDAVQVIFLTSGERGGHGMPPEETKRVREQEAKDAAAILGYERLEFWQIPNGKLRVTKSTVERLQAKLSDWKPDFIYVTHDKEMHPEHRAAAGIVRKALSKGGREVMPTVYMYEVWTPMQTMDHIVDISDYVDIKREAIQAHKCQCAVMSFDEAILGLNRYRGEMHSWPGGDYAEIFIEMKNIKR